MDSIHACHCAMPAITGSTECCKNCGNNPNKEFMLPQTFTLNLNEMKSCSFCKHYFCLINQGIWGCEKNHKEMDASKCEDYDGTPPVCKLTSTNIT